MPPTYFVTGSSRGFGKALIHEILKRGGKAIASARSVESLKELENAGAIPVAWDVTASLEQLQKQAQEVIYKHGPIDVLINNAGYIHQGTVEETTPEELKAQFDTNFFGLVNTTKAFLPHMRERKSGTIVNMGSIGGWSGMAIGGIYCTTKFAVRGISQTLYDELKPMGIKVLLVEPGYFRTEFLTGGSKINSARKAAIADYDSLNETIGGMLDQTSGQQPGDPVKGAAVIVDLVEGTGPAAGKTLPWQICLGADAYHHIGGVLKATQENLDEWKQVTDTPVF